MNHFCVFCSSGCSRTLGLTPAPSRRRLLCPSSSYASPFDCQALKQSMRDMDNLMRTSRQSQRLRTPTIVAKNKEVKEYTDIDLRPRSPPADDHGAATPSPFWRTRPSFEYPSPSGASDFDGWFGESASGDDLDGRCEIDNTKGDEAGGVSDQVDNDGEELIFDLDA